MSSFHNLLSEGQFLHWFFNSICIRVAQARLFILAFMLHFLGLKAHMTYILWRLQAFDQLEKEKIRLK